VFGVSKVEYVGRVIDEHGISFSQKKREFVVNFIRPETQKQMKSFVGLVNHFSSHIRNCSQILRPLRTMTEPFLPKQRLVWTAELYTAFENVRDAFNNLPTMYFINSKWKVYLHTDASDYGVGAYLFQLDELGNEYPIAFLSRSFSDRERRWGVPQKEAYGIFFALSKLEYLLRDIHFTLFTDHENLVYMNRCDAGIIKRWKLAIQEYSFDILHIKGVNNFIADAFSRMIPILDINSEEVIMMADEFKIPPTEYKMISSVHNTICGHMGVEQTMKRLYALGHNWHNMREHVRRFIRKHCPCCQKMSFLKIPIMANHFTASTYSPWERWNIDSIVVNLTDDYGNRHIIVIIDCFSRFIMLYAVKDLSAKIAAECILHCMGIFGAPSQLLSDNGSQYVNEIITELLLLVGTDHQLTLAYSHQENTIVERANKEVMRHLRAVVFHEHVKTRWSKNLPLVQRIFNATPKQSLGVSPANIIFGNAINLDRGIFLSHIPGNHKKKTLSKWMADMLKDQHNIILAAQETQLALNVDHMVDNRVLSEFETNSYVMVSYEDRPSSKLHTNYKGPLRVINNIGSVYTLQNLVTGKNEDHHISKLQPFYYDSDHTDPILIANKDYDVVNVEQILEMSGNPKGSRKDLLFKVRWQGCSDLLDSWESYANLRHNSVLHEFFRANNLKKLIPK
jgi:transposase InsO family protein